MGIRATVMSSPYVGVGLGLVDGSDKLAALNTKTHAKIDIISCMKSLRMRMNRGRPRGQASSFGVLTHTAYNIEYNEDPVVAPETLYVLVLQRSLGK